MCTPLPFSFSTPFIKTCKYGYFVAIEPAGSNSFQVTRTAGSIAERLRKLFQGGYYFRAATILGRLLFLKAVW